MLYCLKRENDVCVFYLFRDKEYVVGRKNADIEFAEDQSISRKHVVINTKGNEITVTDCGSKYGTFHNSVQIAPNIDVTLNHNDQVKFGMYRNKYRLEKIPITTTSSLLTPEEKAQLKSTLDKLDAALVSHWDDSCTHLTTTKIILTVKVLNALIDQKPIVTPEYWTRCLANVQARNALPCPEDFKPAIEESIINETAMLRDVDRRKLFSGKTFVFAFEKNRKKMSEVIRKTGGCSFSWEKQQVSLLDVTRSEGYVFIYEDTSSDSQRGREIPKRLQEIWNGLEKLGERTIPLTEIAMAVIQNSCEKDCNPKFNRVDNVFNLVSPDTETGAVALAQNTPSEYEFDNVGIAKKELVIPESLEPEFEMMPPSVAPVQRSLPSQRVGAIDVPEPTPSTSRLAEQSALDNPPKRVRVCGSEPEAGKMPMVASKTPPQAESEGRKRKAEEAVSLPSPRRRSEKANPFAFLKRQRNDSDSTFRVKEEAPNEDEANPFLGILNRRNATLQEAPHRPLVVKYESQSYVPSSLSALDVTWMSTSNARSELEVICKLETQVEPEFEEMYEMFKDSIVVETLPGSFFVRGAARALCTSATSSDASMERKNFKKFQKVRPRHPQTTILMTVEERAAPEALRSDGEDAADEEAPVVAPRPKKKKKRSAVVF